MRGTSKRLGAPYLNFALLEYAVVHTAEKIERAYLNKYIGKRKRAGMVARDFAEIVARAQGHPAAGKLTEISSTFTELVERRNKLLHANPATLADGTQALIYQTETLLGVGHGNGSGTGVRGRCGQNTRRAAKGTFLDVSPPLPLKALKRRSGGPGGGGCGRPRSLCALDVQPIF